MNARDDCVDRTRDKIRVWTKQDHPYPNQTKAYGDRSKSDSVVVFLVALLEFLLDFEIPFPRSNLKFFLKFEME